MHADLFITNISHLVTAPGVGAVRGQAMRDLEITPGAALAVAEQRIVWTGPASEWRGTVTTEIDAGGCAVVPALVDPHTHAVWLGDRLADFEARSSGATYEQIFAAGGGIRTTIRETSRGGTECSAEVIASLAEPRVRALIGSGAATIEIKSGYGLSHEGEIRLLEAIAMLQTRVPARILPTLLIHVPPVQKAERAEYLEMVTSRLIPEVARRGLAHAVDIFIEKESFSVDDARQVFTAAKRAGLAIKAHVDQFHAIGGLELALTFGALSVDHLEASGAPQVAALATSDTAAVLMPGVALHLGIAAASGRALVDANAIVALATDLNPGSAPLFSMQLAMALGVRLNRLTAAEALVAATANGAAALGLTDTGRIAPGLRADFIITSSADWRDMVYLLGANPAARLFIAGAEYTT